MRTTTICLATFILTACGDDSDASTAGTTAGTTTSDDPSLGQDSSSAGTSTGADPTTAASDPASSSEVGSSGEPGTGDASTGDAPLTPEGLVGTFTSPSCEAYPDGNGGMNFLRRSFTLTADTWHLDLDLFMDAECVTPLFSVVIDGPYTLGELATVEGATQGNFGFTSIVWTAHQQFMADLFTDSGCGAAPWELDVPQDVTETGCIGVAHPIDECPEEYDIVALDDDALYFGARVTDMCVPEGRPTALNDYAVVRR